MSMRMLIDARHPEETRVAVVKGNRIEEFDFESAEHKQLKGNIYLAKVTRVEPSLQAAFVDYGGNRHGFLAFSEIHPDYYQIPKADRDALLREEAEHAAEEERLRSAEFENGHDDPYEHDEHDEQDLSDEDDRDSDGGTGDGAIEAGTASNRSPVDEAAADELRRKRQELRRRYKIQDVIQRRQVLLVQVVKEERGNKGAALTTYLSLAGRYCVLMPNTSHGGGISRKISNGSDRKRLKSIMAELKLPTTMGLIVRTAGLQRTKTEIKRDFDYLARLWDEIRERTLGSTAPALIYRDSDLIKRAIRDLYHREIEEVIVEGEEGYKAARGFMKLLMPSHVRRVQLHSETTPLFQRHGVEDQLSAMYQPIVQLKSGGYLVINPTEALVSIDINSGRSTREHNIEQTAYNTNLEAAQEIARQLRLRDMAGLVVIDFIDMEQNSHVRKVEKAMKEALKNDRARIQVGRISSFGLMEMSRQRLRTGVLEASTKPCQHCEGTGLMRTAASAGLSALRMIEDEATRGRGERILLRAGREAAVYVLNKKRTELAEIEARYGVMIEIAIDEGFEGARMAVESSGPRPVAPQRAEEELPRIDDVDDEDMPAEDDFDEEEEAEEKTARDDDADRQGRRRRRRRRGGRGRNRRDQADRPDGEFAASDVTEELPEESEAPVETVEEAPKSRRRRRGRKAGDEAQAETAEIAPTSSPMVERPIDEEPPIAETASADEAKPKGRRTRKPATKAKGEDAPAEMPAAVERGAAEPAEESAEPQKKPVRKRRSTKRVPSRRINRCESAGRRRRTPPHRQSRRRSPMRHRATKRLRSLRQTTIPLQKRMMTESRVAAGGSEPSASLARRRLVFHRGFMGADGKGRLMKPSVSRFVRLLMLAMMLSIAVARPAMAQDEGDSGPSILRDSETELLFKDISRPLITAAGLDPNSVNVVLLNDSTINAFVATGQTVYIQSGLLMAADNVNQLQGVIAHELGHVAGGHSIRLDQGASQATGLTIATMVLGALAIAAGAGDAGLGIMMAGQQAAMGQFLAFTRTQESSADQAGATYLSKSGISGKGMLDFFGKLQNQEYRLAIYSKDSYARTHPLSSERIQALTQRFQSDPSWGKPVDASLEARFERVKAKLVGFVDPKHAVQKYPETDKSVPAHYARAYAYHVSSYPDKALSETAALLAASPDDPFFLELKGQILLESGKPAEAIAPLREATAKSGDMPLIAAMLGHALVATEDQKNFAEAKQVLKVAVNRDNQNPFAWYQLGIIYDREGDPARAALATAERNNLEDKPKLALASAQLAMRGIPAGSPDWLRAQDIAMVSKAELKKKDRKDRE